jgi:TonB family protein
VISLVLHAGLLALLVFSATRPPAAPVAPLRMRLIEPAAPPTAPPPPAPPSTRPPGGTRQEAARPPAAPRPTAPPARVIPPAPARPREVERPAPPAAPVPRAEPAPPTPATRPPVEAAPSPAPPVEAARPLPEPPAARPAPETPRLSLREPSREASPPRPPRGGLSLGGAESGTTLPPAGPTTPGTGTAPRRSFRDQIASLGSGLAIDDAPAKQTVPLDSREPRFLDYLARVKRRIEGTWSYPEEAWSNRIGGELLLVFTLNSAGTLTGVRLVHSSGYPILDQEALRAVKAAAPYDPFPAQLGDEPWNIAASFRYFLPAAMLRRR